MQLRPYLPLLLALSLPLVLSAQGEVFQKLQRINPHWNTDKYRPVNEALTSKDTSDWTQLHLRLVTRFLRQAETSHLSIAQRKRRKVLLQHLEDYYLTARFPINSFHATHTPYFVDRQGTHCAVGYLLAQDGQSALVAEITALHNNERMEVLAHHYPAIENWATQNGMSLAELAWIQPFYSPISQEVRAVGNGGGANGTVHVMRVSEEESTLYLAGNFTEVDGVAANSIISWDGQTWSPLGDGVIGEVYDLHFHRGELVIVGNFRLPGDSVNCNIATWNTTEWVPLQRGDAGDIYTIETYRDTLYIGGGFQTLDGEDIPYLAYYDEDEGRWSNQGYVYEDGELVSMPGFFSVDDTVRSMVVFDEQLFIGGQFQLTSPEIDHPNILQYEVDHLARWYGYTWGPQPAELALEYLDLIEIVGDQLFLFGPIGPNYQYIQTYREGVVEEESNGIWLPHNDEPALVHGYLRYDGSDFLYGNFNASYYMTGGISGVANHTGGRHGRFNGPVRAVAVFQDEVYFAGDFTEVFDEPFNGLVASYWGAPVTTSVEEQSPNQQSYDFYLSGSNLHFSSLLPTTPLELAIYNVTGQFIQSHRLSAGPNEQVIDMSSLPSGTYVLRAATGESYSSRLLVLP